MMFLAPRQDEVVEGLGAAVEAIHRQDGLHANLVVGTGSVHEGALLVHLAGEAGLHHVFTVSGDGDAVG